MSPLLRLKSIGPHYFFSGKKYFISNVKESQIIVFCCQNCSDLLWDKNVLEIEKNFWNSRRKLENLQNFWDHWSNLFKQWKVRTSFGNRMIIHPRCSSYLINWNISNSNWKKLLGFRKVYVTCLKQPLKWFHRLFLCHPKPRLQWKTLPFFNAVHFMYCSQ